MYEPERGGMPDAVLVDRYRTQREAEQERRTIPPCPRVIPYVRRRPRLVVIGGTGADPLSFRR